MVLSHAKLDQSNLSEQSNFQTHICALLIEYCEVFTKTNWKEDYLTVEIYSAGV